MSKKLPLPADAVSTSPQEVNTSSPRYIQKTKRVDNKKKRLANALRENLLKRKEQVRGRRSV